MTENPQPPSSDTEKLLAELEAERQRRQEAGTWSRARPILQALVGDDETDDQAMERALADHLQEHPGDPASVHAYEWMLLVPLDPPPIVEPPSAQWDQPVDARDVTPPLPPPQRSARSLPLPPGSVDPRNVNIPPAIHSAEARRTRNFNDDTWGDPTGWPIRYGKGKAGW